MKRLNNLFDKICTEQNIELADQRARQGKKNRSEIIEHDKNKELDNFFLYLDLKNQSYKTSKYQKFKVFDPKERVIYKLPYFPDRIAHHAIMNVLEPVWVNIFTADTYSCIKDRGITLLYKQLKKALQKDREGTKYCLKLDIKKFYPSIDHDVIKQIIRKKIKDKAVLWILDEIIDSTEGVPIGNYLSQYLANLVLAYFDHKIKEVLHIKYYFRYADDIVLLSDSKEQLHEWLIIIKQQLAELKLNLKGNEQIFPVEARGIDFVGFVFRHDYILLRKRMKLKIKKLINKYKQGQISKEDLKAKIDSYYGWLKLCNSKHFLQMIQKETGLKYSNFQGRRVYYNRFKGRNVKIVHIADRHRYYLIQFIYRGSRYEIKSKNQKLFYRLKEINYKGNFIL